MQSLQLTVNRAYGTLESLQNYLDLSLPVICAVSTWAFPHWNDIDSDHAVVVIGVDERHVYVCDPVTADESLALSHNDFLAGWSGRDYEFAVISLTEIS